MRIIKRLDVITKISEACFEACHILNAFTINKIKASYEESSGLSKSVLKQIIDNALLAKKEFIPMCQDTGIVICFVSLGRKCILDFDLYEAINLGIIEAYDKFYLRKSVADPLSRINTNHNAPAIVHIELVDGDQLSIKLAPKGAGSENMSKLAMLNPSDGIKGIKEFVVKTIKEAGGKPCPPIFIGIGIGGNFEKCALMAKEALFLETRSDDKSIASLELEILDAVNELNIGPMGLGGITALDCFIKTYPCHIASLPVAVNIQCHANRHVEVIL